MHVGKNNGLRWPQRSDDGPHGFGGSVENDILVKISNTIKICLILCHKYIIDSLSLDIALE